MFSRSKNASKVVLVHLLDHLRKKGFVLLDCQQTTDHLLSMGAEEVSRCQFQHLLQQAEVPPYGMLASRF
jgi:leucyl/phenylalanyl-tRNA--protein transferase